MKFSFILLITVLASSPAYGQTILKPLPDILKDVLAFNEEYYSHKSRETADYHSGREVTLSTAAEEPEYEIMPCLQLPAGRLYFKSTHVSNEICRPGAPAGPNYIYIDQNRGYLFSFETRMQGISKLESFNEMAVWPLADKAMLIAFQGTGHSLEFYLMETDPVKVTKVLPDTMFPYLRRDSFSPEQEQQVQIKIALPHMTRGDIVAYAIKENKCTYQLIKWEGSRFKAQPQVTVSLDSEEIINPADLFD